jgi:hypothetical protein
VTVTLNGATLVVHETERTAPVKLAVQPAGTAPAEKVTVPANPLIGVTVTVEVPATVARVVMAGADREKSWIVTGTVVVLDNPPLVPVTVTLNAATPVAQVTDKTAPVKLAVQPAGTAPAAKVTVPANPLIGVTVTVEVPATVASVVIAGADKEKSWIVTGTVVVLDNPPLEPVTVTPNGATPVAQVTDKTAPVKLAVQPTGTLPAAKVTAPANPLIGVIVTVDVPATVARVVIAGAESEKS